MVAPPVLLEPEQGELPTKTAPPVPTPEATSMLRLRLLLLHQSRLLHPSLPSPYRL
ncbi:hypothetical protein CK203_104279 [Vitis vinifera]|uniref:Uncharacterized protein n=1 Tax=Vitis vinifera TaxID=29760 RepID=A0A438C5V3_VITVI|nr:hypothetical protein CK203_104279 [Vitis vinifera]